MKIDKLLTKVEALDGKMNWVIRGQSDKTKILILDFFKNNRRAAQIYLEIDGKKSTKDIAKKMRITQGAVTQHCSKLLRHGMVETTRKYGVYKKDKINNILQVENMIRREVLI